MDPSMKYVPSPIQVPYGIKYQALVNKSGRMQYYKQTPGESRERIGRQDFIYAYNKSEIIAIKPLKTNLSKSVFQLEFYVTNHK